jgi:hypothetical protein
VQRKGKQVSFVRERKIFLGNETETNLWRNKEVDLEEPETA